MTTKPPRPRIWTRIRSYLRQNRLLVRIFLTVMSIMTVIMVGMTLVLCRNSARVINRELNLTNYAAAQKAQSATDELFRQTQRIGAWLLQDSDIYRFLYTDKPNAYPNYNWIDSKLRMYFNTFDVLDSIYLYSDVSGMVYRAGAYVSGGGLVHIENDPDRTWQSQIEPTGAYTSIFPRTRADYYPYYLSVLCRPTTVSRCVAVLNINMESIARRIDGIGGSNQFTYIVCGDQIYYRRNMQSVPERVDSDPLLREWAQRREPSSDYALYEIDGEMYAIARVRSANYDWDYVSVTQLRGYHDQITQGQSLILLVMAVVAFSVLGIVFLLSTNVYRPIRSLQKLLDDPHTLRERDVRDVQDLAARIVSSVNTNDLLQRELDRQLSVLQKLQISALQIQINPHFLSNVLNLINLTIVREFGPNHRSCEMICELSDLLRYGLDGEDSVSLRTEIHYTKVYLSIMQQRYLELFTVQWDMDPAIFPAKFPKLCLQPVLENAIYYGLAPLEGERAGKLTIAGRLRDGDVFLTVTDNGAGMSPEHLQTVRNRLYTEPMLNSRHIGMRNVNSRLRLLYGEQYGLRVESVEHGGTAVTLHLPFVPYEDAYPLGFDS